MMGRIHYGRHAPLEDAADEILSQALGPLPATQKTDILTPWKEKQRRKHEVYTNEGVPTATYEGNFHRVYNARHPHLNNVAGRVPRGLRSRTVDDGLSESVLGDMD